MNRAAKPRDLVYLKVRVRCKDSLNRSYYSSYFGIINESIPVYNRFLLYLSRPSTAEDERVNSKFSNNTAAEKYWNKGHLSINGGGEF